MQTKDVSVILGIGDDTARKILKTIKVAYGKAPHQSVTIREFCEYEDLPYDEVYAMINNLSYSPQRSA
jgi:hypothetical protein